MADTPKPLAVWYLRAFNADRATQLDRTRISVQTYAADNGITNDIEALAELIEYAYDEYKRRKQTEEQQN